VNLKMFTLEKLKKSLLVEDSKKAGKKAKRQVLRLEMASSVLRSEHEKEFDIVI